MAAVIPKGYVLIARDILGSTLWQHRPEDRVAAITAIVLSNHQAVHWYDGQADVLLARGQFVRSWPHLAKGCNLTHKTTRNAIARLVKSTFLTRKAKGYYSIYTLPKYGLYQDRDRYGREKAMPKGAILVARQILESSLWKLSAQDRVVAITCLLVANYASGAAEVGGREVMLSRGQFSASWDKLAGWCHLPVEKTQESVARLITSGFLIKGMVADTPVFSIPNYEHYQDPSKYAEAPRGQGQAVLPDAFLTPDLPFPAPVERAGGGQGVGSPRAGGGQEAGREWAADKNVKNVKKGEEGDASPTPELVGFEPRGAAPPLPPGTELANAYQERFPGLMRFGKALNQVSQFMSRGGNLDEGLQAVRDTPKEPKVVIWKILDPLVDKKRSCLDTWVPPERRVSVDEREDIQSRS